MIEAINLVRLASDNFAHRINVPVAAAIDADAPAFIRRPSSGIQIQIPQINIDIKEAP